jgi:hypothetical protein
MKDQHMQKKISIILQYLFFLGLGAFLVWWSMAGNSAGLKKCQVLSCRSCFHHSYRKPFCKGSSLAPVDGVVGL